MRNVLKVLDCMKKMGPGLVVDLQLVQVVVYQLYTYPSEGISYSQVCGKSIGYQYYSTDGVVLLVLILMEFILMVLVSYMVILVVIFGGHQDIVGAVTVRVALSVPELLLHLFVMTMFVILVLLLNDKLNSTLVILSVW